jgi:hypothetical protein
LFLDLQPEIATMFQALFSLAAVGVVLGLALVVAVAKAVFGSLASVPGPFVARFTDLWYGYRVYRGGFEKDNIRLHEKYGMPVPSLGSDVSEISVAPNLPGDEE